jgi:acyl-coenzyme A synthetase/AMP-(fatty) acid ligase
LASYKTPRSIEFVNEIPKTGTGKVMRRELRDAAWQGQERRVGG